MFDTGFFIKNILIIGNKKGKNGEYHNNTAQKVSANSSVPQTIILKGEEKDSDRVKRIIAQILLICDFAKKNQKDRRLVVVTTDEFCFYPESKPFSIDEYKTIINCLAIRLESYPPNIVLIISSLPILWPDGTLRSSVLHCQTPNSSRSKPILHHFSKEYSSNIDPLYSKDNTIDNLYSFQADNYSDPIYSPNQVLLDSKIACNNKDQFKSAIIVRAKNLPPIIQAIDICLDHKFAVAMKNAEQLLTNVKEPVFYISHIITSNYIDRSTNHLLASPVHADWADKTVGDSFAKNKSLISAVFGTNYFAYSYPARRAEILHSSLFEVALSYALNSGLNFVGDKGNTLLHEALLNNSSKRSNKYCIHRQKRVETILNHFDAEAINCGNQDGDTPLHLAVQTILDEDLLIRFLEQGARLDKKNKKGLTPLGILIRINKTLLKDIMDNLVGNHTIYLTHRDAIREILVELQNLESKTYWVQGLLASELQTTEPNELLIIDLLEESGNPLLLINRYLIYLLSLSFSKSLLTTYLFAQNTFSAENSSILQYVPFEIKLQLIRQGLDKQPIDEEKIGWLLMGGNSLLQFTNDEYRVIFSCKAIVPTKIDHLNNDEINLARAYLARDTELAQNIFTNRRSINAVEIANLFNPLMAQNALFWFNQIILKIHAKQIILDHFSKGSKADLSVIVTNLFILSDLKVDCGLNNGLSIEEQIIAQLFISKDTLLQEQLDRITVVLNRDNVKKAIDSFEQLPNSAYANPTEVKTWFYQTITPHELRKNSPCIEIIMDAMEQGKELRDSHYACYKGLSGPFNVTLVEQALMYAYRAGRYILFDKIVMILAAENNLINTEKLANIYYPNTYDIALHKMRLDYQLDRLYRQIVIKEQKKGAEANFLYLQQVLPKLKYTTNDCELNNGLNIAQQAIALAYIHRATNTQTPLLMIDNLTDINQINLIAQSFNCPPNASYGSASDVKIWLHQEYTKNELNKLDFNKNNMLDVLSQDKQVREAHQAILNKSQQGLNTDFNTILENNSFFKLHDKEANKSTASNVWKNGQLEFR